MADQHVFGFKHAAGADVHHGLDAVADPLPPDADTGAVAALACAPPLPMNADRARNVVGQPDQFERGAAEEAQPVPGAGLRPSAVHSLGGGAGHDAERSHKLGVEGVKDHDGFKASQKVEGEKEALTAKGDVVDHFEREATEGAVSVPGAGVGASRVHPLSGGAGRDAERSHKLGAEGVKDHDGFKASEKVEGEKTAEGTKEAETAEGSLVDHLERESTEGAASVPGAGVGASGVHPLGGGVGHDAERSRELGVGVVFKAEGKNTAQGAKEVETADGSLVDQFELEGAASVPGAGIGASRVHSLGGGSKMDADLSDKSDAEREEDDGESEKEREDGDDAEREEDGAYVKVAARWAIAGVVGLGAALVAYAAVRARYQPFHGGALQRDCLIVDDATTAAIPDAHPYCLLDGSNAPMESISLPFQKFESTNPEPQSEIGFGEPQEDKWAWVMNDKPVEIEITPKSQGSPSNPEVYGNDGMSWEKFIPRGGTATAVASTPVEDLSYRRITMAALLVAAVILFLGLVIPILMYL